MDHHTTERESTTIDIALLDTLIGDSTPSRPTLPTETKPLPTYTLTPPEELAVLTVRLANLTKRIVKCATYARSAAKQAWLRTRPITPSVLQLGAWNMVLTWLIITQHMLKLRLYMLPASRTSCMR
jgi:hypothetical protein